MRRIGGQCVFPLAQRHTILPTGLSVPGLGPFLFGMVACEGSVIAHPFLAEGKPVFTAVCRSERWPISSVLYVGGAAQPCVGYSPNGLLYVGRFLRLNCRVPSCFGTTALARRPQCIAPRWGVSFCLASKPEFIGINGLQNLDSDSVLGRSGTTTPGAASAHS
jgi:hypothetical protein